MPRLPAELDGLRIAHLSDFHLGVPSPRRARGRARASNGRRSARPDLVAITGDLLTHPRGEPRLRELVERAAAAGVRRARQPRSRDRPRPAGARVEPAGARSRRACSRTRASCSSSAAGRCGSPALHPRSLFAAGEDAIRTRSRATPTSASCSATSRACSTGSSRAASISCSRATCTTVRSRSRIRAGRCGSRIRRRATRAASTARAPRVMHVSPGLGTTFVPFRFAARPEATELVLRSRAMTEGQASISADILARYAADAASEVEGVRGLAGRRGVTVERDGRRPCASSCTRSSTGARRSPRSAANVQDAGARVSRAHGGRRCRRASTSSSTRSGRRRDAHRGPHRRDAADGADASATSASSGSRETGRDGRQAQVDPRHRGGVGRVGDGLLRRRRAPARLDAVRPVRSLPARRRAAGRARRARTRCSSRARISSTRRSRG